MKKRLMILGLSVLVVLSVTACGKRVAGTIQEGLPENVQKVMDDAMNMDELITAGPDDLDLSLLQSHLPGMAEDRAE